ncbi:MAG: hypothetical protein KGL12_14000 [Rhodospirillales bacterium]|nr:hypothetical protein [Rhodospirillales bacterium]
MAIPPTGSVLGIDVGFSTTRASSALCRLDWTPTQVTWTLRRFRARPAERAAAIAALAGGRDLAAVALDGPLLPGLAAATQYRLAEKILTVRALAGRIGKPGQPSTPLGRQLNAAANLCAGAVLAAARIGPAEPAIAIDAHAIAEAFPSSFLGLMLDDPEAVPVRRADRSDRYFVHLAEAGRLAALLAHLLAGRRSAGDPAAIRDHDERAGFICALTALGLAAGDFTAVGGADGWIVLPPRRFLAGWAAAALAEAAPPGALYAGG